MALFEALNSTGRVTNVNNTVMPNNIIPRVIREFPIADEKLKRSPKSIRGKNNLEPKLTAGTIMLLRDKGA